MALLQVLAHVQHVLLVHTMPMQDRSRAQLVWQASTALGQVKAQKPRALPVLLALMRMQDRAHAPPVPWVNMEAPLDRRQFMGVWNA